MNKLYRIIDANYNRAKEGLRVCEDIMRFVIGNKKLTKNLKDIRHNITLVVKNLGIKEKSLIEARSAKHDVGKETTYDEINKKNLHQVFLANLQRVKESIRVLEEVSKIINKKTSKRFKGLRYQIYEIEKAISKRITSLLNK